MREAIAKLRLNWLRPEFGQVNSGKALFILYEPAAKFPEIKKELLRKIKPLNIQAEIINILDEGPGSDDMWSLKSGKEKNTFVFPAETGTLINLSSLDNPLLEWQLAPISSPRKIRFDRNYAKFYNFILLTGKEDAAGRLAYYIDMTDKFNLQ